MWSSKVATTPTARHRLAKGYDYQENEWERPDVSNEKVLEFDKRD
jgi:hypothetical protein